MKIKVDEKVLEALINGIVNIKIPDFIIINAHAHDLRIGNMSNETELMLQKHSEIDETKQKLRITVDLVLQESKNG